MFKTPDDLRQLQALLDESVANAGAFLRSSFEMPEHSLSSGQLVAYLAGLRTVALATVTARGEPRVAPTGALFLRGRFAIPTVATAVRARHVAARPAVSLTLYDGNDLAIIAHGQATIIADDDPDFAALERLQRDADGTSVRNWGDGVFLRVTATALYTYARQPDRYPAIWRWRETQGEE